MHTMMDEDEFHARKRARDAQHARLAADGLLEEGRDFPCLMAPSDTLKVVRQGDPGGSGTTLSVVLSQHGHTFAHVLTVADARRLVAELMDLIDNADPAPALTWFKGDN